MREKSLDYERAIRNSPIEYKLELFDCSIEIGNSEAMNSDEDSRGLFLSSVLGDGI